MSDEKIITHQDVIDGLEEEIAALEAKLARARPALIAVWARDIAVNSNTVVDSFREAEARYKREIAQQGEEG